MLKCKGGTSVSSICSHSVKYLYLLNQKKKKKHPILLPVHFGCDVAVVVSNLKKGKNRKQILT